MQVFYENISHRGCRLPTIWVIEIAFGTSHPRAIRRRILRLKIQSRPWGGWKMQTKELLLHPLSQLDQHSLGQIRIHRKRRVWAIFQSNIPIWACRCFDRKQLEANARFHDWQNCRQAQLKKIRLQGNLQEQFAIWIRRLRVLTIEAFFGIMETLHVIVN